MTLGRIVAWLVDGAGNVAAIIVFSAILIAGIGLALDHDWGGLVRWAITVFALVAGIQIFALVRAVLVAKLDAALRDAERGKR